MSNYIILKGAMDTEYKWNVSTEYTYKEYTYKEYKWSELQDYKIIDVSQYWDQLKVFLNSDEGKKYIKLFKQTMKFRLDKQISSPQFLNTKEGLEYIENIDGDWHDLYKLSIIDENSIKVYNTIKKHIEQDNDHWSNVICIDRCHYINTVLLFPFLLSIYGKDNIRHVESCRHTIVINIETKEFYDLSGTCELENYSNYGLYSILFDRCTFVIKNEEQLRQWEPLTEFLIRENPHSSKYIEFKEYFLKNFLI